MLKFGFLVLSFAVLAVVGCGKSDRPGTVGQAGSAAPAAAGAAYLLNEAPDGSVGVVAARESAADGDDIVVEGRIGGAENPWVEGRAAFQIVDRSLVPCNERHGDGCKTPWDYCCDTDKLPQSLATIKFLDADGKTLGADSRQLLGIKELQTVVVKGKAKRDESGNLTVVASGLYVKPAAKSADAAEKTE